MSALLVADYQRRIAELLQYGGNTNEDSIRKAFARLLDDVARPQDLRLIEDLEVLTAKGTKVCPDGTLKDALRLPHGYWEAKDEHDDLDEEIQKKRAKGYPTDNILFEDSRTAVLIQNGQQVQRVSLSGEPERIAALLQAFVTYESEASRSFTRAIEQFKQDMPKVLEALRDLIEQQQADNKAFTKALKTFLALCRSSINESVTPEDVREMLIQHVLTEDTLPFSALREVNLHASLDLPADKQFAIANLRYGTNAKMMLGFDARPWVGLGGNGASYSDLASHQTTWETNPVRASATRGVITDYSGGRRGANLDPANMQGEAQAFLTDLDQVFPGALAAASRPDGQLRAHLEHWPSNPLTLGSYTANPPGYFTTIADNEATPVGRLYFAGEHTSSFYEWQGFMEGAVLSGHRAAAEVLGDARLRRRP